MLVTTELDAPGRRAPNCASEQGFRASVIVVSFNGRRHLEQCLPAIAATTGADVEVLVVDNGSTDGTVEWLADIHPGVKVLALGRNRGFGAGNRHGAEAARGDFVVLLNNDTVVEPGWLDALLAPLEADPEIAASCATLRLLAHPGALNAFGGAMAGLGHGVDRWFGFPLADLVDETDAPPWQDCLFPTAAAMAMRRNEFLDFGGFDPSFFMYHEDVDLGWRLWLLGRRVVVCRTAVVGHAFLGTSAAAQGLEWRARLGLRHLMRSQLKHAAPGELVRAFAGLGRFLIRERAVVAAGYAVVWNLLHLPDTLRARWWLQRRRTRSTVDLVERGLVLETPLPPPTPELPRSVDPAPRLWSPSLWPGRPSAVGRLGIGWYAAETTASEPVRHTCGHAWAILHLSPGTAGRLEVELRPPPGLDRAEVRIRSGSGTEATANVGPGWEVVTCCPVTDVDGRVEVELRSGTAPAGADDPRVLGCAVRRIELVPETPAQLSQPQRVSVVIPTHDRWPILAETLTALARQSWSSLEVIVVDDGSSDGTFERLEAVREGGELPFALTALRQPNRGQGVARNLGIAAAGGDLVLLLGDDVLPDASCVAEHVAAHRRLAAAAAVVGHTAWDRAGMRVTPFLDFVERDGAQFAWDRMADGTEVGFAHFYTSNVSLPREVAATFPFDPAFAAYGWEDIELGARLEAAGLPIVYHRAATARHRHPSTLAAFVDRQRRVGCSYADLLARRPELEGDPRLPRPRPPRRLRLETPGWWVARPAMALLDRLGIPLPWRLYRELVHWAFYRGLSAR